MKKHIFCLLLTAICVGTFIFRKSHQSFKNAAKIELSRADKDAVIERALALELPGTNTVASPEVHKISADMMQKVRESEYEQAIDITLAGLAKYPHDFELQADLASLIGDTSEITDEPLKGRMLQKAGELFERLLKELDIQPKEIYYQFKNEYYYRNAMYREQYENGIQNVAEYWGTPQWKEVGASGYYRQGVGAANYAKVLMQQQKKALALEYAQKAIVAWAQYFSYANDYYNAYVHYALALGILGYHEEMMRALQRSASIIKRDLDYFEFKEVTDFIDTLQVR